MKIPLILLIILSFILNSLGPIPPAQAQELRLPVPGVMLHLSPEFTPAQLVGITIHPDNALKFDFFINRGDISLSDAQKKEQYSKLIKYFLASLTIPDQDQWVNLSPYENSRIIKDDFGKTEMGRDLLAQDYILKQITSSLIYPESNLGKEFWDKVYERAWKEYGTTSVPVNTFNKVWIIPDEAVVYESQNTAYILRNHLKVMLEEDYLSLEKYSGMNIPPLFYKEGVRGSSKNINTLSSQLIRQIILPELEKEVNQGQNFANLRQIYSGMILATWYKHALKESLLGKIYANQAKVAGLVIPAKAGIQNQEQPTQQNLSPEQIYQQYLKAFKKGVFNYIKDDIDKYTQQIILRKYFSGGTRAYTGAQLNPAELTLGKLAYYNHPLPPTISSKINYAQLGQSAQKVDRAVIMFNPTEENKIQNAAMNNKMPPEQIFKDFSPQLKLRIKIVPKKPKSFFGKALARLRGRRSDSSMNVIHVPHFVLMATLQSLDEMERSSRDDKMIDFMIISFKVLLVAIIVGSILYWYKKSLSGNHFRLYLSRKSLNADALDRIASHRKASSEDSNKLKALLRKARTLQEHERIVRAIIAIGNKTNFYRGITTRTDLEQYYNQILEDINEQILNNAKDNSSTLKQKKKKYSYAYQVDSQITVIEQMKFLFEGQGISMQYTNAIEGLKKLLYRSSDAAVQEAAFKVLVVLSRGFQYEISRIAGHNLTAESEGGWKSIYAVLRQVHPDPEMPKEGGIIDDNKAMISEKNAKLLLNPAMAHNKRLFQKIDKSSLGGINFNSANMDLQIKRDSRGVPLGPALQNMAQLSRIQGLVPEILEITPAGNVPIISELLRRLHSS